VSIIGAGSVGSSLARVLHETGYTIVSVISRSGRPALALARAVKCKKAGTVVEDISPLTELIIIATPDGSVAEVAKGLSRLKKLKVKKLFVAHTSGVLSADVLEPLKRKGAIVSSIHPIQSFTSAGRTKLKGIYFGLEGDPKAVARAEQLVNSIGGKSITVPRDLKPLYHVACVFASGYMVVFLNAISELAKCLDLKASWTEVFGPLMTTAMENSVKHTTASALTGPILRGDLATVDCHLLALSKHAPEFLPLYTIGGIEVARIAKDHGRIGRQEYEGIISRFRKFIQTSPIKHNSRGKH
jgi:predicted short-subunit dehydrogenase-like oxidoreductase (DUF2520 family)